jgi:hypothetical protein
VNGVLIIRNFDFSKRHLARILSRENEKVFLMENLSWTGRAKIHSIRVAKSRNRQKMLVKIECECGQRYAFDVEPASGKMPSPVGCPSCRADGTAAADEFIARQLAPVADVTATAPPPVRLAEPANSVAPPRIAASPAGRRADPRLGLVDHAQAEHEARAKAMWGDSPQQVVSYLMIQGFAYPEAQELARKLFRERASTVRSNGIRKVILGIGFMCVPVIAAIIFAAIGMFLLKLFAAAVLIGLYGLWLVINGILMAVAPKSERGDVANQ